MLKILVRFVREEEGQDFAEYALILGAVGMVAIAVIDQGLACTCVAGTGEP